MTLSVQREVICDVECARGDLLLLLLTIDKERIDMAAHCGDQIREATNKSTSLYKY